MIDVWNRAVRSSGLWRFVTLGTRDAVGRLARLTGPVPPDETGVSGVLESSATVRAISRLLDRMRVAAGTSVLVGAAVAQTAVWRAQSPADRMRSSGIVLLTAAGVYVGLSLWRRPVAGWLWLVAPVLAAAFGVLMAAAPGRALRTDERR